MRRRRDKLIDTCCHWMDLMVHQIALEAHRIRLVETVSCQIIVDELDVVIEQRIPNLARVLNDLLNQPVTAKDEINDPPS